MGTVLEKWQVMRETREQAEVSTGGQVMTISMKEIGRGLAAARELAGFRSAAGLVDALKERHGIIISASSIYGYERGENEPPFSIVYAIIDICDPPGGLDFFARALSSSPILEEAREDKLPSSDFSAAVGDRSPGLSVVGHSSTRSQRKVTRGKRSPTRRLGKEAA